MLMKFYYANEIEIVPSVSLDKSIREPTWNDIFEILEKKKLALDSTQATVTNFVIR